MNNDSYPKHELVDKRVSLFAYLDQDQPTVNYEILLHAVYSTVCMPLIIAQNKK
jgi:hypothetical protein